ncbi:MAG: hypothetical protein E6G06_17275 [Actinobacteria bacterium]|nr:MAG: hypothetical protein E6G06_17275 [Actinomycetota bacterium]
MRFEELSLRIPGDELRMRFHEKTTVLSGLGALERQGLVESLLGALAAGPAQQAELTYIDAQGRRVRIRRDPTGDVTHSFDDGSVAPDFLALLGVDLVGLRDLAHVRAGDLGLLTTDIGLPEPPELAESRAALAELNEKLESALAARQAVEAMRMELSRIDEGMREADEGRAKRRYARLLTDLERVRAEATAMRTGDAGAAADKRFVEAGRLALRVAERWHATRDALKQATADFGDRERLDARTLAESESMPEHAPAELDALVSRLELAESRRNALAARLSTLATSRLPEPSHPSVVRLARGDQETVWETAKKAIDSGLRLERESINLGGLAAEGVSQAVGEELEEAHEQLGAAERLLESRQRVGYLTTGGATALAAIALILFPLAAPLAIAAGIGGAAWSILRPRRRLAVARGREEEALNQAGVPTYLSFHMRRIDATIDPGTRERLDLAALEHRVALGRWHELAGPVDPVSALEIEKEVRDYAHALSSLDGAAEEIDAVRLELTQVAEPHAEEALAELMRACEPFGVDDPRVAAAMVRHQIETASTARLQLRLEAAENDERHLRDELYDVLKQLGFEEGEIVDRVGGLEHALAAALGREQARDRGRDKDVVERELVELEARVRQERRPEWGAAVTAFDGEEPDVEALARRRESTAQAHEMAAKLVPDVELLADRRNAVERRVAVLESSLGEVSSANPLFETPDIEQLLLARVVAARNAGPMGEALPVLLDEPFLRLHGESKWAMLDLVERLAEKTQMIYLTDDVDVVVWARRRSATGVLALLEPVAEIA